jgi:hypothetical protein
MKEVHLIKSVRSEDRALIADIEQKEDLDIENPLLVLSEATKVLDFLNNSVPYVFWAEIVKGLIGILIESDEPDDWELLKELQDRINDCLGWRVKK